MPNPNNESFGFGKNRSQYDRVGSFFLNYRIFQQFDEMSMCSAMSEVSFRTRPSISSFRDDDASSICSRVSFKKITVEFQIIGAKYQFSITFSV